MAQSKRHNLSGIGNSTGATGRDIFSQESQIAQENNTPEKHSVKLGVKENAQKDVI